MIPAAFGGKLVDGQCQNTSVSAPVAHLGRLEPIQQPRASDVLGIIEGTIDNETTAAVQLDTTVAALAKEARPARLTEAGAVETSALVATDLIAFIGGSFLEIQTRQGEQDQAACQPKATEPLHSGASVACR